MYKKIKYMKANKNKFANQEFYFSTYTSKFLAVVQAILDDLDHRLIPSAHAMTLTTAITVHWMAGCSTVHEGHAI